MRKVFQLLLLVAGVYLAIHLNGALDKTVAESLAPGNNVVMYSLTTCPYCREKREWMTRVGIPFTEVFVDRDKSKYDELTALMAAHHLPPGGIGTPIVLVNGTLLVNNPGKDEIKKRLRYRS